MMIKARRGVVIVVLVVVVVVRWLTTTIITASCSRLLVQVIARTGLGRELASERASVFAPKLCIYRPSE